MRWAIDRSQLPGSNWTAVVLRNVPPDSRVNVLYHNCTARGEKVKYITKPQLIKGQHCCFAVMENIEEAEKLCARVNGYQFSSTKKLKAHIHPASGLHRPDPAHSHHKIFARLQTYLQSQPMVPPVLPARSEAPITLIAAAAKVPAEEGKASIKAQTQKKPEEKRRTRKRPRAERTTSAEREKQRIRESVNRRLLDSPPGETSEKKPDDIPESIRAMLHKISAVSKPEVPVAVVATAPVGEDEKTKSVRKSPVMTE